MDDAAHLALFADMIVRSGVPKLSLGEKAILTATPDYVRDP